MSSRTYQQSIVWDKLTDGIKAVEAASDKLESRASAITAGSAAIVAIISGANLFPKSLVDTSTIEAMLLGVLCVLSLVMFWLASKLWGPRLTSVATGSDVDKMYDEYIAKDEDVAFNNALIDLSKVFECSIWTNRFKRDQLNRMVFVLQLQIAVLGIGVLAKVFC